MEQHQQHSSNPLTMYDLTIGEQYGDSNDIGTITPNDICKWMFTYCKRWCFQLERGAETGYRHYQCRISLISKKRVVNMKEFLNSTGLPRAHFSPTSNPSFYSGNEFYVMKEDTKIEGPWSDRITVNESDIPSRLQSSTPAWRPWQQHVIDICHEVPDDRTINVIFCKDGKKGKTFLSMWMKAHKRAQRIPPQKEARDIMRLVMCLPITKVYFIDLPRASSTQIQKAMYSAIEEIKNGYCYDDRYAFKDKMFDPPHVWVFTNVLPDKSLLSEDRWAFWTISDAQHLIPYETDDGQASREFPSLDPQQQQHPLRKPTLTLNIIRQ